VPCLREENLSLNYYYMIYELTLGTKQNDDKQTKKNTPQKTEKINNMEQGIKERTIQRHRQH
jgi:hypothetical protein